MPDIRVNDIKLCADGAGYLETAEIPGSKAVDLHFITAPVGVSALLGLRCELTDAALSLNGVEIAKRNSLHVIEFVNTFEFRKAVIGYKAKEASGEKVD